MIPGLLITFLPIDCALRLHLIREYDLGLSRQDWLDGAQVSQWAGNDGRTVLLDRTIPEPREWENGCTHYMAVLGGPSVTPWEAL